MTKQRVGMAVRVVGVSCLVVVAGAGTAAATPLSVDCSRRTLQAAIDGAANGATITITGVCHENARIDGKALTLQGAATPGPHGIQGVGVTIDDGPPALAMVSSSGTTLQGMSISNGPNSGIVATDSTVSLTDCTVSTNFANGIEARTGSRVTGLRVLLDSNEISGIVADSASQVTCDQCDLTNNLDYAVRSFLQAHTLLRDSVVTGAWGLDSEQGGDSELDCQQLVTGHACSLAVDNSAASAHTGGIVTFNALGGFTGTVGAIDHGQVRLLGAGQSPGGGSSSNFFDVESDLLVTQGEDEDIETVPSSLTGPIFTDRFSRVVLGPGTTLVGTLFCAHGADAVADAETTLAGSTVTGCAHLVYP